MKHTPARKILDLKKPRENASCLVADSPHSGRDYPADFRHACGLSDLRRAEDAWLDKLFDFLAEEGVTFLAAKFPRSYVDVNRADDVKAKHKRTMGVYKIEDNGLVRGVITPALGVKIYDRHLSLREVFNRINRYYLPYRRTLRHVLADTQKVHGKVVHLNCHSMPSTVRKGTSLNRNDIIIGTGRGKTASPALVTRLKKLLEAKGYKVGVNIKGYTGGVLVRDHGAPKENRHSIQLEINRKLYMNEETLEILPEAERLKTDLREVVASFRDICDGLRPRRSTAKSAL